MSVVQLQEQEQVKMGEVIQFNKNKEVKLKLDGTPKQTPCNSIKGDPHEVYPIKDIEDIKKMKQYFRDKIEATDSPQGKQIAGRDLMCFSIGINIGLRMSDILNLKWDNVFDKDGTFADTIRIKEKKTSKFKNFFLNQSCKNAINNYINEFKIVVKPEAFLFRSRQGGAVEVRTVGNIIKNAGIVCEIKLPLSSHTCRKTYAYHQLKAHQNDVMFLTQLMVLLNHTSLSATLKYCGVSDEVNKQCYDDVNL